MTEFNRKAFRELDTQHPQAYFLMSNLSGVE